MRQFNWGHGIFLVYTIFVAVLIITLIASTKIDRSLVTKDYYAKDLTYQEHYDKLSNQETDQVLDINHLPDQAKVVLRFNTADHVTGQLLFYRPSDNSKDFVVKISDNIVDINTGDMTKGKWIIKADWVIDKKAYYKEATLFI